MDITNLRHLIALTFIPGIGDVSGKNLVSYCGSAEEVFKAKKHQLLKIPGIGPKTVPAILAFNEFDKVDAEIEFIQKKNIQVFAYYDDNYPKRLKNCDDAPLILYYKGNADLNASKMISIIGTRKATDYGKLMTEKLVEEFAGTGVTIISGLAYGIDIYAHRSALENKLPTIGVMAHGLNRIYPAAHKETAAKMIAQGGLLTEFPTTSKPDRENFPKRNRIVAGMSDAIIVVETKERGGAMITAEIGNSYNRDVFAVPGRVNDKYSEGCNYLLKNHKAAVVESAADIVKMLNWEETTVSKKIQKEIFIELSQEEKLLADMFAAHESLGVDYLHDQSNMSTSQLASVLLNLEFKGVIRSLPGKIYKLS